jgi:hypothetical protein
VGHAGHLTPAVLLAGSCYYNIKDVTFFAGYTKTPYLKASGLRFPIVYQYYCNTVDKLIGWMPRQYGGVMSHEATVVFTAQSLERILAEGGTTSWRFAVCTRNANADWVEGPEAHHAAFLVGKVRDVVPCPTTPENKEGGRSRFLIQFSEFAQIDIPNIWKGDRNPVKYRTLEELGINPSKLKWEVMPVSKPDVSSPPPKHRNGQPLTMAEAKKGLALTFNVPPEAIEITIRG